MPRRCLFLLLLVSLLWTPPRAWGQAVSRQHLSLLNPLEYGEDCTTATLTATIAAAPATLGVLMITPVNRAGAACTWAITSNLSIPSTLVLHVPQAAVVNVSAGVTLTLQRCPREDTTDWRTGPGTITVVESPCGGGGGGEGGTGDITGVWTCSDGECSALTAAGGHTFDAGSATSSKPATRSTTLPATCTEGHLHHDTDAGGSELYVCTASNTWTKLAATGDLTGGDITDVWTCATGDCSALTAASGDTFDAGAAASSRPATRSTSLPATCVEGQQHQDTDSGGSETYICTATNTWTKLAASGEAGTGDVTDVWTCTTGDCSALTAASGDTFDAGAATSSKPATRSTSLPATCTEGQWHQDTDSGGSETYVCTTTNTWAKLAATSEIPAAAAGYAVSFTGQTTVTILGTTHGLGTADLFVQVKDNSTPRAVIVPQSITVHDSTYDVVVTFSPAQSGRIIVK